MPRDSMKSRLYRAETIVWSPEASRVLTLLEAQEYVDRVVRGRAVRQRFAFPVGIIVQAKRDVNGSAIADASVSRRRLRFRPGWARPWVIMHELAHLAMPRPSGPLGWTCGRREGDHGRAFSASYLALVRLVLGREDAEKLRASFALHGIRYTKPRKLTPAQRATMIERLAAARVAT